MLGLGHLRGLAANLPILVGLFPRGPLPDDLATRLIDLGAAAIGGNCQDGMAPVLELVEALRGKPIPQ